VTLETGVTHVAAPFAHQVFKKLTKPMVDALLTTGALDPARLATEARDKLTMISRPTTAETRKPFGTAPPKRLVGLCGWTDYLV
jgi:hypothetical protein